MRIKKIYFNRMYDQWRGEPLYVEDGLDDDKLYIRIMDVENYKRGAVNTITVDYKDLNGATYTILGECDYDKKLAVFDIPLSILSNNGVYEVSFSLSFNNKDKEGVMLKTAIQTFEIIDTIEADDEAIAQDPHYPILVDLINQLADYKVDTSIFPTREEMVNAIDESINLDKIIEQINDKGYITQTQLNNILKNYLTKFESSDFARRSDLNKFVTNIKFIQELDRYVLKSSMNNYVLKEEGKTLTTHDLTDELYEKLVNLDLGEDGVEIDLSEYQKKIDDILNTKDKTITGAINEIKNDIPTKTSQLQNDSGYLTEHQDLSDYAKKTELHSHENKDVLDNITTEKVSSWDNKSEFDGDYDSLTNKPTIPTKVSELENDNLFVTEKFVNDKIIEASLGKEVDLSEYAKKTDIPYVPTKVSELENDKGYASEQFVDKNIPIEIENLSGTDNTKTMLDYLKEIVGFFISDTIILGNKIKYKHIIRGKINTNISINEKDYSNISYISMINVDYNILTTFILADEGNLRIETPYTSILDDTDMYIGLSINQIGEVYELIGSGSVSGGSSHEHDNKDILDTITQEMINTWNNKSDLTINDNINEVSKTQTYSNEMIESRLLETNTEITAVQDDLDSMDERVTYLEAEQTKMGEFDGSYNSLTNKPVIPSKTSELTNDSEFTTKEYVDENDYYTYPTILYDDNSLPLGYVDITTLELTKVYKIQKGTLNSSLKKIPLKAPNDDGTWFIVDDGSNNIGWGGYNDTTITVFAKSNTNIMIYMNSINGYNKLLSIKKTDGVWGLNQSKINVLATGNTQEYTPTKDYNPATKKYVDDKVAGVNASTITGLATVATSGDYNDLTNKPTIPSEYALPTASATQLGGVKIGTGLSINDGVLSANGGGTADSGYPRFVNGTILAYVDEDNILERSEIQEGLIEALNYAGSSQSGVNTILPNEMDSRIKNLALALNNVLIELRKTINISGDIFIPGGAVSFNLYVSSEYTRISFFTLNKYYMVNCYLSEGDSYYEEHSELMLYRSEVTDVVFSGSYNDLTNKPTIPTVTSQLTNDSGFITSIPAEYITDTYLNNKLSSMPKSLAGHDGAQVLSYIDKHNVLERENMVDKAFQVFTSLFYSTSTPTSGDISNLSVVVVDFANTIMNACTEFGEDIFLYFDFILDSPIKFVVMPSSSSNMFLMIIDDGKTSVGLQIEFTGDGTGQYTRTSTELVSSNEIATVATSGNYNDLTNKPTIPTVTNNLTDELKANYDSAYEHSQSAHAPTNAQKNSDITKAEIEAKLIGNITTHTHSQYLTSHQSLDGYVKTTDLSTVATTGNYSDLTNKPTIPTIPDSLPANGGNAETVDNFHIWQGTQAEYDAISSKDANTIYLIKEG